MKIIIYFLALAIAGLSLDLKLHFHNALLLNYQPRHIVWFQSQINYIEVFTMTSWTLFNTFYIHTIQVFTWTKTDPEIKSP